VYIIIKSNNFCYEKEMTLSARCQIYRASAELNKDLT
jgi:hypothetical protein